MNRVARNGNNNLNGNAAGGENSSTECSMYHRSQQASHRFESIFDRRVDGPRRSNSSNTNGCDVSFASPEVTAISNDTDPLVAIDTNEDFWRSRVSSSNDTKSKFVSNEESRFDPVSIKLKDLQVGPASSPLGVNSATESSAFTVSSLARRVSSETDYYEEEASGGIDFDVVHSSRNNYRNGSLPRMAHKLGHNHSQRQPFRRDHRSAMLKEPPQTYVSSRQKHNGTNAEKKAPPSQSSFKTHDQGQESYYHHFSGDLKSPPQTNLLLSTRSKRERKHREHRLDLRSDRPRSTLRTRPARIPSIPRAIDVDTSYSNYHEENGTNTPAPPPLSPISCSSSTYIKRKPIENYYASRESIEKQLSDIPPISDHFPNMVAPLPFTDASTSKPHTRPSTGATAVLQYGDNVHRTDAKPTNTTTSGLPKRTASAVQKNRPEKPLRINSQYPSQLQLLQQQRRFQEQEQMRRSQKQTVMHPTNSLYQKEQAHSLSIDIHNSLAPCPPPTGSGSTNDVVTRIYTMTSRPQEYDLQFSSPATASPTNKKTIVSQTRNKHHKLPQEFDATKVQDTTVTDDKSSLLLSTPSSTVTVEIYPGVCHILRGAEETASAAKRNFVVNCVCVVCTVEFSAIADAAFVICPTCMVVNALGMVVTINDARRTMVKYGRWGVGLGYIPDHR